MNHWRYDECGVAFYHDGIEKSNHDVADALNAAESRITELEATIEQLIAAGESLTRVAEWRYANLTELFAWDTLVENIYKKQEKK